MTAIAPRYRGPIPARWALTLEEPLLSVATRARLNIDMSDVAEEYPHWTGVWFAGVVSDLMVTLPPNDPWRHLSAHITGHTAVMTRGDIPRPPLNTGAVSPRSHGRFGEWTDGTDFWGAPMPATDVSLDRDLVALEGGLPDEQAAFLAFCADGWESGLRALDELTGMDGMKVLNLAGVALRWAWWRRRFYENFDGVFLSSCCYWWEKHAHEVVETGIVDAAALRARLEAETVSADQYSDRGGPMVPDVF